MNRIRNIAPVLHRLYTAVHAERNELSKVQRVAIMSNIMARMVESWRVIGITPAALEVFRQNDFKTKARSGITRAHFKMGRAEMVEHVLQRDTPMTEQEFVEFWMENDVTVICARGENRDPFDVFFIPLPENDNGELFQSLPLAGFKVGKAERELMQKLLKAPKDGEE